MNKNEAMRMILDTASANGISVPDAAARIISMDYGVKVEQQQRIKELEKGWQVKPISEYDGNPAVTFDSDLAPLDVIWGDEDVNSPNLYIEYFLPLDFVQPIPPIEEMK